MGITHASVVEAINSTLIHGKENNNISINFCSLIKQKGKDLTPFTAHQRSTRLSCILVKLWLVPVDVMCCLPQYCAQPLFLLYALLLASKPQFAATRQIFFFPRSFASPPRDPGETSPAARHYKLRRPRAHSFLVSPSSAAEGRRRQLPAFDLRLAHLVTTTQ